MSLGLQVPLALIPFWATCLNFPSSPWSLLLEEGGDPCGDGRTARSDGLMQAYLLEGLERWFSRKEFALPKQEDVSLHPSGHLRNLVWSHVHL